MSHSRDEFWMTRALTLAKEAAAKGEVPVGAVMVLNDECVGEGFNQPIRNNDPTCHAEIIAMRAAAKQLNNYRLLNTTLYVTLEPCLMCVGAMVHARIKRLVFAALDPKTGAVVSQAQALDYPFLNHRVVYDKGVLAEPCGQLLSEFFKARRTQA